MVQLTKLDIENTDLYLLCRSSEAFPGFWVLWMLNSHLHPCSHRPPCLSPSLPFSHYSCIFLFNMAEKVSLPYPNFIHKESNVTCSYSCLESPTSTYMRYRGEKILVSSASCLGLVLSKMILKHQHTPEKSCRKPKIYLVP